VFDALRAGAVGYLLKDVSSERLVEAIRAATRGASVLQPSVASKVVSELNRLAERPRAAGEELLSPRELDVLRELTRGASNKEIAVALDLAEGTVKNHVTSIFAKLEVTSRTAAAMRAHELHLV
jgi:DNA-binding NarL/FixJ family response regulator